jgi:hypothetical protein
MGYDIHGWIERRTGAVGGWVAHQPITGHYWDHNDEKGPIETGFNRLPVADRNYEFFGYIAGVRGR